MLATSYSPQARPGIGVRDMAMLTTYYLLQARPGMGEYVTWQNSLLSPEEMAAGRFIEIPALHQTAIFRRAAVEEVLAYSPYSPYSHTHPTHYTHTMFAISLLTICCLTVDRCLPAREVGTATDPRRRQRRRRLRYRRHRCRRRRCRQHRQHRRRRRRQRAMRWTRQSTCGGGWPSSIAASAAASWTGRHCSVGGSTRGSTRARTAGSRSTTCAA